MFLQKWKVWLVFFMLAVQPALFAGQLFVYTGVHLKMIEAIAQSMEVKKLDVAINAAKEGAKSPLEALAVSSPAQLESMKVEARTKADESLMDLKNRQSIQNVILNGTIALEFCAAVASIFLIGGLLRKNNLDKTAQAAVA